MLCSGQFVLLASETHHERVDWLAFEMSRQRDICVLLGPSGLARVRVVTRAVSSEIRWLNVKQPTSTLLWLERGPDSLASETRHERVELALARSGLAQDSSTSSTQALARTGSSSRVVVSSTQSRTGAGSTGPSRVWSRLGDISKRPARPELAESSSPPARPELREFPAKTLNARPSRPVVEC